MRKIKDLTTTDLLGLINSVEMRDSEWARKYLLIWHKDGVGLNYHPLTLAANFPLRVAALFWMIGLCGVFVGAVFSWAGGSLVYNLTLFPAIFCVVGFMIIILVSAMCWSLSLQEKQSLEHFRGVLAGIEMVAGQNLYDLLTISEQAARSCIETMLVCKVRTLLCLQAEMDNLGRELTGEEQSKLAATKIGLERYHGAVRFTGLADKEWTRYFQIAQRQLDEEAEKAVWDNQQYAEQ